jgi:hypothetical protein
MSDTDIESFWEWIRPPREQQLELSVQPAESKPVRFELSITGVGGTIADFSELHAYVEQWGLVDPPYSSRLAQGHNPDVSMGTRVGLRPREVDEHIREVVLGVVRLRNSLRALGVSYDYDCSDILDRITALAVERGHPASYVQDLMNELTTFVEIDEL